MQAPSHCLVLGSNTQPHLQAQAAERERDAGLPNLEPKNLSEIP